MFYFTYVLRGKKDNRLYTGYTRQLRERLNEHNQGLNMSTKGRGPFELIYFEACLSEEAAQKRERQLKSGHGKRYLKSRLGAPYF
ncbi:excinuclease ABC subunit C [Candidatus Saccharibacteria bacterium RIFCSPHIGHO2_12_FULL_49_19]|nr:MAG: excinuclease ABC subunit C [Candidatus Saccharibacteria bacterium RIFCSPHIGHO2_01_FULL_49_21]OGL37673.1 MAG: excinuclease ABC subunit C [Candidatus Saccharibacteria bacterium RIFCSPHIGHO2_12_FULL_49_19]OGL37869.1 MAG: excinuclease ABC subunit C [Candidatus Saccharibacteria bacterium RIFCSPLOWO2_01_FULL_49_22]